MHRRISNHPARVDRAFKRQDKRLAARIRDARRLPVDGRLPRALARMVRGR